MKKAQGAVTYSNRLVPCKGQGSLEFLMIFGIGFLLIMIMAGVFFTFSGEAKQSLDKKQLEKIGRDIMNNVENVYFLGSGNRITMNLNMPDGIENITIKHINDSGEVYDYMEFSFYQNKNLVSEVYLPKENYIQFDCTDCAQSGNVSSYPIYDLNPGPKRLRIESKGDWVAIDFIRE